MRFPFVFVAALSFGCIDPPTSQPVEDVSDLSSTDTDMKPDRSTADLGMIDVPDSDLGSPDAEPDAGVFAADWTMALDHIWFFDNAYQGVGGETVTPQGAALAFTEDAIQGTHALQISENGSFAYLDDTNIGDIDSELNAGAWVRFTGADERSFLGRWLDSGWAIGRNIEGKLFCSLTVESMTTVFATDENVTPNDEWAHVVCTFSNNAVEIFVNGRPENRFTEYSSDPREQLNASVAFGSAATNDNNFAFTGGLDEVFVHEGPLPRDVIRRIYACGIDGTLCSCDDAGEYSDCGRESDCSTLIGCDSPPFGF